MYIYTHTYNTIYPVINYVLSNGFAMLYELFTKSLYDTIYIYTSAVYAHRKGV